MWLVSPSNAFEVYRMKDVLLRPLECHHELEFDLVKAAVQMNSIRIRGAVRACEYALEAIDKMKPPC
jgi:hypothetical protein